MMPLNRDERAAVIQLYVLANTPSFLYRRLRRMPVVQRLAEGSSVSSLAKICSRVGAKKRRKLAEVATAYASLVALTLKEPQPSRQVFDRIARVDLDWASEIVRMHLERPTAGTTAEFHVQSARFRRSRSRLSIGRALTKHVTIAPFK